MTVLWRSLRRSKCIFHLQTCQEWPLLTRAVAFPQPSPFSYYVQEFTYPLTQNQYIVFISEELYSICLTRNIDFWFWHAHSLCMLIFVFFTPLAIVAIVWTLNVLTFWTAGNHSFVKHPDTFWIHEMFQVHKWWKVKTRWQRRIIHVLWWTHDCGLLTHRSY